MADAPWREAYFADLQRTPGTYWPFTESRPLPFASPYINVEGWSRRTYQAPASTAPRAGRVDVRRLDHLRRGPARRVHHRLLDRPPGRRRPGLPVEVENYGQRGWTHFQEAILFEQLLADADDRPTSPSSTTGPTRSPPRSLLKEAVPSHTLAATYADASPDGIATELVQEPPPEDVGGESGTPTPSTRWPTRSPASSGPSPPVREAPDDPDDRGSSPAQETDGPRQRGPTTR